MKDFYPTHANEASKIVPSVQKLANTVIQVPLFGAGTNSKNQELSTGPPPKPTPTKQRKLTSDA